MKVFIAYYFSLQTLHLEKFLFSSYDPKIDPSRYRMLDQQYLQKELLYYLNFWHSNRHPGKREPDTRYFICWKRSGMTKTFYNETLQYFQLSRNVTVKIVTAKILSC